MKSFRLIALAALVLALLHPTLPARAAADTGFVQVRTDNGHLDANVRGWPLPRLLEAIAASAQWQVMVEPGVTHTASVKFKDLPVSEGLRMLLGNLNFAVIPQSNAAPHLYVFRSSMNSATQLIRPSLAGLPKGSPARAITNELVLRLKPGAKIDDLARKYGAKVIGKIDGLNAYRLSFDSADDAASARDALAGETEVAAVDSNYSIEVPSNPQALLASSVPPLKLQVKAPGASGRVLVGLVDTAIQPLGGNLDGFVQPQISVAGEANPNPSSPTHATSMAETILTSVQNITGGSSSVQILPVDVYGNSGNTTTFDVALGITKAVNAGANPINLSLGSQADSSFLHDVIQQASQQGVVFYGAAGNEPVTTPTYPAAYPEVTAVTAADAQRRIADYANRGSFVNIIAPGTSVVYYGGRPFLTTGTSTAAAYASGMAAGLAEVKGKTLTEVDAAMRQSLKVQPAPTK